MAKNVFYTVFAKIENCAAHGLGP